MIDVLVVGAGHNGLVCAAYLARAGLSVEVVEARATVGGCASTVDALGARVNICSCDHTMIRSTPILDELDLAAHGLTYLEADPAAIGLQWDGGPPLVMFRDAERTVDALSRTHPQEAANYRRYLAKATPVAKLVLSMTGSAPTPGAALKGLAASRSRGLATLLAWSRRPAGALLQSFFAADAIPALALTTGPVVWGLPPSCPGTGLGALGLAMRHLVGVGRPVGGSGALPDALHSVLTAAGGRVRTGVRVAELLVERDTVCGARLTGGEEIRARVVVSSVDPRTTLLRWLTHPPAGVAAMTARMAGAPTPFGYESKLDAVITERPRYRALTPELLARLGVADPLVAQVVVAPTVAEIEAAHAALPAGQVADRPMFLASVPSVLDPSMRAADGDVFSLEALWTPYAVAGGWPGSAEPERWLARFASLVEPGFLDGVARHRTVTPVDYEAEFGLDRGYAPSFAGGPLAALLGRDRSLTRYRTPVRGLFLTGAGTFPGAGVWGASGRNAAAVVLRDPAVTSRRAPRAPATTANPARSAHDRSSWRPRSV